MTILHPSVLVRGARTLPLLLVLAALVLLIPQTAAAGRRRGGGGSPHEKTGFQLFTSPQANPIAVSPTQNEVYVANTTSNRVDVINTATNTVVARISVGIDPVSVAVRPDGNEVWVSNHVSDTVSVIDTNPASATHDRVVETIQNLDGNGVTLFDEPVGIAFKEDGSEAYVALSSRNQVAVVDTTTYQVTGTLDISAQEPRALAVRGGLLYVAAFESNNQTELSACPASDPQGPPQCTLDENDLGIGGFAVNPNLPALTKHIVVDPDVPDRDLFVFDLNSGNALVEAVTGVGTLLYGVAVDSSGTAWISQTEARNAANGTEGLNLVDLQNRIFENQIAAVNCGTGGCGGPAIDNLEPPLPTPPNPDPPADGTELATPYGIAVSGDDSTLVVTAAASSRVFSYDTGTGTVLHRLDVGAIPRGVAFDSSGATGTAYVLNTLDDTVSVLDVGSGGTLTQTATINVGNDPTVDAVRLGRIALNDAGASTSGTFSCASCHPDGNTDQLLWRIGGNCDACSNDEIRSTMPVRGLKNTHPLHWDGSLGDPFAGPNGSTGPGGSVPASCSNDQSCFRNLVDAALSGVNCDHFSGGGGCPGGGELTATERDNMATFLQSVSYPPPRSRAPDDTLTTPAADGFADFFVNQGGLGAAAGIFTCGDISAGCHSLPLGASTCDALDGGDPFSCTVGAFDAPTMRGMTDRFLQFSLGITNPEEMLQFALAQFSPPRSWNPATEPLPEDKVFMSAFPGVFTPVYNVGPDDIFQMFEEASTGFAGAIGRQVTLNTVTTNGPNLADTQAIIDDLEAADADGLVNLRGKGLRSGSAFEVSFRSNGTYTTFGAQSFSTATLISEAQAGTLLLTLTAQLRASVGDLGMFPQPLLAPNGATLLGDAINQIVPGGGTPFSDTFTGIDVRANATVFVDGDPTSGTVSCASGGTFNPFCWTETVSISFPNGLTNGLHFLQVQNPKGLLSNEIPVCAGVVSACQ